MKINRRFNTLNKTEYFNYISNYKKYSDFNTLGLYRSICENIGISLSEKIEIRDYTNQYFEKTFEFLQLKDPQTYFDLITLGLKINNNEEKELWNNIRENQEKLLADKKINHRNFGKYAKHTCDNPDCPKKGIMLKQGLYQKRKRSLKEMINIKKIRLQIGLLIIGTSE